MNISDLAQAYEPLGQPVAAIDDSSDKVLFLNSAFEVLSGYPMEEVLGHSFRDFFQKEDRKVQSMIELAKSQESTAELEEVDIQLRRKSGRLTPVQFKVKSMDIGGRRILLCSFTDLSKLRELERQREEIFRKISLASKLADIGRLAAGVAHEINNPLMIIHGRVEKLLMTLEKEGSVPVKDTRAGLNSILNATHRMAELVRQMVRMTREEDVRLRDLKVKDVFEGAKLLLKSRLQSNEIEIDDSAIARTRIKGDFSKIEQIVVNVFSNAIHALEGVDGPRKIHVSVSEKTGKYTEIKIWNSGPPIPAIVRQKLMTPFFTTKPIGKGAGLGLYVSQGIMRAHGGDLICDDCTDGCSFTLLFPRWQDSDRDLVLQQACILAGSSSNVNVITEVLDSFGMDVIASDSTEELGWRIDSTPLTPRLLIVDSSFCKDESLAHEILIMKKATPQNRLIVLRLPSESLCDSIRDSIDYEIAKPINYNQLGNVLKAIL